MKKILPAATKQRELLGLSAEEPTNELVASVIEEKFIKAYGNKQDYQSIENGRMF